MNRLLVASRLTTVLTAVAVFAMAVTLSPTQVRSQEFPPIEQGVATAVALRGLAFQETPTSPPPTEPPAPTGLRGMPFAPYGLSGCDEMAWYRAQAGLPAFFDGIGYRESRCQNTAENSCCHGWWQLHEGNWSGTSYAPLFRGHCWAQNAYDTQGHSALNKQRQACSAMVMYSISGTRPWSQTR